MPNLRDIRRRIKSVKNTAQITRAMQLVAASKMKRAQQMAVAGRPYAALLGELLTAVHARLETKVAHPLLDERPVKTRGILLLATDKGLCGPLNSNLFRLIGEIDRGAAKYVTVGRKATQFITRSGRQLIADFPVSDRARFGEVRPILELLLKAYTEGEIDTIEVAYPEFVNALRQEPLIVPLAPVTDLQKVLDRLAEMHHATPGSAKAADERDMKFEPSPAEIVSALVELYLKREIYQMVLEAKASEHSARMVAMKTATDNAKGLAADLTLSYNKARQAAITQEILEIAAAQFSSKS